MFGVFTNMLKSVPSLINTAVIRTLKHDAKYANQRGINHSPKLFRHGQQDLQNMPDMERVAWKDQNMLYKMDKRGMIEHKKRRDPLNGSPQLKGIVLKTCIRKPKKPNSANRKCVVVRLSNGKEATVFVPGIGHNLQEHSNVMVEKKRVRDTPGIRLRVIRGVYDCSLVIKQTPKK